MTYTAVRKVDGQRFVAFGRTQHEADVLVAEKVRAYLAARNRPEAS